MADVIAPLPLAVKVPTRAMNAPFRSEPLISKAYCPFKLELEKPTGVGVGVGVLLLPPPQAAARFARQMVTARKRRFTGPLLRSAVQVSRWAPKGSHACYAPRALDSLFAPTAPRTVRWFRTRRSPRRSARCHRWTVSGGWP